MPVGSLNFRRESRSDSVRLSTILGGIGVCAQDADDQQVRVQSILGTSGGLFAVLVRQAHHMWFDTQALHSRWVQEVANLGVHPFRPFLLRGAPGLLILMDGEELWGDMLYSSSAKQGGLPREKNRS